MTDKKSNKEVYNSFVQLAIAVQGKEVVEKKMSKINPKNKSPKLNKVPEVAYSFKGNLQYVKSPEQQLYEALVMTLLGKDDYHESGIDRLARIEETLAQVVANGNLDFVASAILYARNEMNIRSMPIVITGMFAKQLRDQKKTYPFLRQLVARVIQRADQIADMYAVAFMVFGDKKKVPMAIKRGVADAFNKFNEYAFAKYNRNGVVKLRDVLRIVHPVGKDEDQKQIFERIMKDALTVPYTWEVELSKNGQLPETERKSDAQVWAELIQSGKIGYMAMLRNLRNIWQAKVSNDVKATVAKFIQDPEQVAKSKQLPFRFISALDALETDGDRAIKTSLFKALDHSLGNVPQIGQNVWIIIDCSGSMGGGYGRKTTLENVGNCPIRTACLFAAALAKAHVESTNLKVTMFSDNAKHIEVNPLDSVGGIAGHLISQVYGGGTNLQAALNLKKTVGFEPDTVFVLSDMQVDRLSNDYSYYNRSKRDDSKKATNIFADGTIQVAVNLSAYATTPVHELNGWYQVSGWSDKIFDFVPAMRAGSSVVEILKSKYDLGSEKVA